MSENHKKINHRIPVATIVCASLAVIVLAVSAILINLTSISHSTIIFWALGVYLFVLLCMAAIAIIRTRMTKGNFADIRDSIFGTIALSFTQNAHMPILICDEKGKIIWYNTTLYSSFKSIGVLYGKFLDHICDATLESIAQAGDEGKEVSFVPDVSAEDREADIFCAKSYRAISKGKIYYVIVFENVTETRNLQQRLQNEETMIAYAMIDKTKEKSLGKSACSSVGSTYA